MTGPQALGHEVELMLLSYGIPRAMQSLTVNWRASLNSMLIISASLSVLGAGVLLYLNVVQFGPCTFGAAEASGRFFGRSSAELTAEQAALLAASLLGWG